MSDESFGQYYKRIRTENDITQDYVANYINRKKMTISLIENEKNEPPEGSLLLEMINALGNVSNEIKSDLIFLSARSRRAIPVDIADYFYSNPEIYKAIKRGATQKKKNNDWAKIFDKK